jgi:uncharacterized linocin/CFP29 family protein
MGEERLPGAVTSDLMNRIEGSAVSAAREILSGRRIIDVEGSYGVSLTTVEVGNDDRCREPGPEEASAVVSRALSVPMIYRRFAISKRRIAAFRETGQPLNLKVAEDAAQAVATREEEFIYHGQPDFHLGGLLTVDGRQNVNAGNWDNVDEVLGDVIAAVNVLDGKGYRGPYGLALAPDSPLCRFRSAPDRASQAPMYARHRQSRHCRMRSRRSRRGIIVLGQDLQVSHLTSDAAHENFAVSESLILKIEAPDAICTI